MKLDKDLNLIITYEDEEDKVMGMGGGADASPTLYFSHLPLAYSEYRKHLPLFSEAITYAAKTIGLSDGEPIDGAMSAYGYLSQSIRVMMEERAEKDQSYAALLKSFTRLIRSRTVGTYLREDGTYSQSMIEDLLKDGVLDEQTLDKLDCDLTFFTFSQYGSLRQTKSIANYALMLSCDCIVTTQSFTDWLKCLQTQTTAETTDSPTHQKSTKDRKK